MLSVKESHNALATGRAEAFLQCLHTELTRAFPHAEMKVLNEEKEGSIKGEGRSRSEKPCAGGMQTYQRAPKKKTSEKRKRTGT
jgi:hypothetical protein